MLVHIYLPKPMLALRVIKLMNALQFTLLCRMWAQHSKIYRIWPAFCGICIWRSPRLTDGSSRRYQKLIHVWHFEAHFEKVHISSRITKLGLPRVCDLSWAANGWPSWFSCWCRLSLVLFEWFHFTWLFNTVDWMPEKKNQTAWATVSLTKMRTARRGHKNPRQNPSIAQP